LKEPNTSPPGVCCNAQNAFDPAGGRYIRFPSFSGSHGWQWWREIYLNDASVWTYDLASNTWRNMRPLPAPHVAPLRCASWDSDEQVVVVFGGEGGPRETLTYNPHRNEWRWMKPKLQPEPRSGGQMAYDAAHKVHVMFGSQFTNDPHTWIYDLRKNEWSAAQPESNPRLSGGQKGYRVVSQLNSGKTGEPHEKKADLARRAKGRACAHHHQAQLGFASDDFAHLSELVVLDCLLDFCAAVHHERTLPENGFVNWLTAHHQKRSVRLWMRSSFFIASFFLFTPTL